MATTNNYIKSIYQLFDICPTAGEFLHNFGGYDFNKPIIFGAFETPTTYKKIFNNLGIDEFGKDWQIMALLQDADICRYRQELNAIKIINIYDFSVNISEYQYIKNKNRGKNSELKYTIDCYYRKSDAENTRKTKGNIIYIIAQKKEFIGREQVKYYDNSTIKDLARCKIQSVRVCHTSDGAQYINKIEVLNEQNKLCNFEVGRKYGDPNKIGYDFNEIFDKNGYFIFNVIKNRQARAQQIRTERAKKQADEVDYNEINNELNDIYNNIKLKYIDVLTKSTSQQFIRLLDLGDNWKGIKGLFDKLDYHIKKSNAKTFCNVSDIYKSVWDIKLLADEINEKINNIINN